MVKYVLTKQHFLNNVIQEPGTEVEWGDQPPSLGMEGIDDAGKAKCKERDDKQRGAREQAVKSGFMSQIAAENVVPKPEQPPVDEDEDDEDHPTRGRRSGKR